MSFSSVVEDRLSGTRLSLRGEVLPHVDAAFGEGRISCAKVRHLTRVATEADEAELVGIAQRTPAGRLCGALARWQACHEEPEDAEQRRRAARSLRWRTEADGMISSVLRLGPPVAAVAMTAAAAWILQHPIPGIGARPGPIAGSIPQRVVATRPRTRPRLCR